ncbi:MAG: hypothetical protein KGL58_07190, partial [Pseudomonadota bacterium]|nr:hypothetical protein [Pseudomonadota bacterium]
MTFRFITVMAVVICSLAGCMTPVREQVQNEVRSLLKQVKPGSRPVSLSILSHRSYVLARYVRYSPDHGPISIQADGAPFYALLAGLGHQSGWSLSLMQGVNVHKAVTVTIHHQSVQAAMRHVALAAGYAMVFDPALKTAVVTPTATDTFHLPLNVMQQLTARYDVGGNPVNSDAYPGAGPAVFPSTDASALMNTGGMGAGSGLKANFSVQGGYSTDARGLGRFIGQMAGTHAQVHVMPQLGLISVQADALALERINHFLARFTKDALRRVEIQASVIEVDLGSEFEYGIDWSKVLGRNSVSLSDASSVASPVLAVSMT